MAARRRAADRPNSRAEEALNSQIVDAKGMAEKLLNCCYKHEINSNQFRE